MIIYNFNAKTVYNINGCLPSLFLNNLIAKGFPYHVKYFDYICMDYRPNTFLLHGVFLSLLLLFQLSTLNEYKENHSAIIFFLSDKLMIFDRVIHNVMRMWHMQNCFASLCNESAISYVEEILMANLCALRSF